MFRACRYIPVPSEGVVSGGLGGGEDNGLALFDGSEDIIDAGDVVVGIGGGVEALFEVAADFVAGEGECSFVIIEKLVD